MPAPPTAAARIEAPANFDKESAAAVARALDLGIENPNGVVELDLSTVERFDSSGMALVVEALERARARDVDLRLVGAGPAVHDFFSLVSIRRLLCPAARGRPAGALEHLGGLVLPALESAEAGVRIVGSAIGAMCAAPFRGERTRAERIADEVVVHGVGAIPITALIGFLLGLILAMQAWVQLRVFGAEIYIADMVAVGVTREIGPLMTAILVAARSGSAMAAQLGTMVINEEVDALRQMGVNPLKFLVAPKVVSLALATPCLTMLFTVVAIGGGALFGVGTVGLGFLAYFEQTHLALRLADLSSAIVKSFAFGALVASVGCSLGLRVVGGPEGVGKATTRAVVSSIFLIIVVDAIFVVFLRIGT